jgi:hypothetical protein
MTPYAQKREEKLGRNVQLVDQPPRYLFPEHLIGIRGKHPTPTATSPLRALVPSTAAAPLPLSLDQTTETLPPYSSAPMVEECATGLCAPRRQKHDPQEGTVQQGSLGGKITSFDAEPTPSSTPSAKPKSIVPPKKILKLVGQAISDWGMIQEVRHSLLPS